MRWITALLSLFVGGYMLFDGVHALRTGEYVVPSSGSFAGQLGPWASILRSVHVDPHALLVKLAFVVLGTAWLVHTGFILTGKRNKLATTVLSILTLWYAPFGTIVSIVELIVVWRATS